jgi:twitching motility protein PilT
MSMETFFDHALAAARQLGASDVHLKSGLQPVLRVGNDLRRLNDSPALTRDFLHGLAMSLLTDRRRETLERTGDARLVWATGAGSRQRIQISQQRGGIGISIRLIPPGVPTLDRLGLPAEVRDLLSPGPGLVLVASGPVGGKTTTLAAMVDQLARAQPMHIVTIEDPVEIQLEDRQSVVVQREVGLDLPTTAAGLRAAARQGVDAIMVSELADPEAAELALAAAENGRLVLAGVAAPSAEAAIARLRDRWPADHRAAAGDRLSAMLRGVLHQRLVTGAKGKGRTAQATLLRGAGLAPTVVEDTEQAD